MLLTLKERIMAVQALPKEGDVFTQRVIRDLKEKLGLSDEDWKTYEVKSEGGRVIWNAAKDKGVEFKFGAKALDVIKESLAELNKQKKMNEDYLSLYDKFFPEDPNVLKEENIVVGQAVKQEAVQPKA